MHDVDQKDATDTPADASVSPPPFSEEQQQWLQEFQRQTVLSAVDAVYRCAAEVPIQSGVGVSVTRHDFSLDHAVARQAEALMQAETPRIARDRGKGTQ